ncbi:hypothetical protein CH278_14715 [Rhodococcus sp. 05-2254-5]|uniref:ketopantoate reductase family protein n=1 Tax=unclassified Rhodococcus (in: high G+C Gram-positive bacteria) TaxID=192944 RepID=UPI000B9B1294|nr:MULTISPECIES: 2-dehydropantoate 2-reductase [unclassified Rhodococcus (in: high G+C Gram-positive bacteria)]OZE32088.1 hypothetical protein CH278_14715 [Rhodococcus sp. 05-2254-5]OZE59511.1 hypothetical protein CH269_06500 [Rhodococcus sp. 05-2254-1]
MPTKVCIYGAGAVGGHLAGRLAAGGGGPEVSVIARGPHLAAVRERGLRVRTHDGELHSHPSATDRPGDLEPQDIVFVTVKAPTLPSIAADIASLLHDDSLVVFVSNGIPWWYFHSHGGPLDGTDLRRLDPDLSLFSLIGPDRSVGAVAYTAGTVVAPGEIAAINPRNRLILGRPDGRVDSRLEAVASLFDSSGLEATTTSTIRDAVWAKLSMNLIGGALGVLSSSVMKDVLDKPPVAATALTMVTENGAIARALGCEPADPGDVLRKQSASTHLQSVVQDLQAGRPMEIDALFRVPLELAALADVPTPTLSFVIELVIQRARAAGLYRDSA